MTKGKKSTYAYKAWHCISCIETAHRMNSVLLEHVGKKIVTINKNITITKK